MSEFSIRKAQAGDEPRLAKVHIQSWQEAYRDLLPGSFLNDLDSEYDERVDMWQSILKNPKRYPWVVTVGNEIVGFILFGPPRDENRESYIELGAIYLLEKFHGKGIGHSLLSTGFDFMKAMGYKKAYCWMLEGNSTRAFYEKTGAVFKGETKTDELAGKQMVEQAYEWPSLNIVDTE